MDKLIDIINSDPVQAVGTIAAFGGVSLRDFITNKCLLRAKEVINDTFTEEDLDEEQKEILFSSILELENYFFDNEDIDPKLFEELLKASVNGVKIKEELIKEYLKILKNMTFFDLKIFKIMFSQKTYVEDTKEDSFILEFSIKTKYSIILNYSNELEGIPIELIKRSLDRLSEVKFIKSEIRGEKIKGTSKLELDFLTELGEKIIRLL